MLKIFCVLGIVQGIKWGNSGNRLFFQTQKLTFAQFQFFRFNLTEIVNERLHESVIVRFTKT